MYAVVSAARAPSLSGSEKFMKLAVEILDFMTHLVRLKTLKVDQ